MKPPLQCGKKKGKTTTAAPAAHRRYLSSPAATTLHGKTQGFVLRLPPQNKAHETFMQPSQCVLQHDVANWQTHMYLRTWQQSMTAIMQPLQCDLQPQIPKHPITTHAQAHPKQSHCYSAGKKGRTLEVRFIADCSHFTRKNTRFHAPASSPTQSRCDILAAITMRFAA